MRFFVKRNIAVAACCAVLVCLLALLLPATAGAQSTPVKPLTLESIFTPGEMTGRGPEAIEWSPDGTRLSYVQRDEKGEQGELWYMDAVTGEKKLLVSAAKLASLAPDVNKVKNEREKERLTRYHVAAYLWAPDSKHLIFDSQGQLWLYDLATGTAVQFTSASDPSGDPKFSPDGNRVAYTRKHNLYVRPVVGNSEKQLTKDSGDSLFNGDIDWVYAEELYVRSNYFWSPDSKQIVYLHMDETKVPIYPITDWTPTHPSLANEKYPKVGDPNPVVKLGVVDPNNGKTRWLSLTNDEDILIPRFGWVRDGIVLAEVLSRTQEKADIYFVDVKSGKSRKVMTEDETGSWIEGDRLELKLLKTGDKFLWESWRDGNSHIYLYSFDKQNPLAADAKMERQLTQGDFQVGAVEAVDEASGTVFFSANKDDPRQHQLFSVKLDGSGFQALSHDEGTHFANFAEDSKHYLENYSKPQTPPRLTLCAVGGACNPFWQARSADDYGLIPPKFLEFKDDDGTTLYGRLLLPPDAPAGGKIPLIINIYGGPAAQMVLKGWSGSSGFFDQILVRKGFAIFAADNRGTPGRDRKFQTALRHEFGALELKDQLTALDQLEAQYPQLDKDRVAIWGWSNGGSMTLYAMTHSDRFRAGVAVAPVTSQLNYDTIYTERYMGLLADDNAGYEQSDVTRNSYKLHRARPLVHVTCDDNVHFQNSIQVIDAFIKAGKQFRLMIYPNKTHGIAGKDARVHLFTMIEDQFERELK